MISSGISDLWMNDSEKKKKKKRTDESPFNCITWICALFPAVMLEMVQHASFRIDSLALLRRCSRHGRAEQFSTTWNTEDKPRSSIRLARATPQRWLPTSSAALSSSALTCV